MYTLNDHSILVTGAGRGLGAAICAVLGDSTFLHSGITPLMDAVYNGGYSTTIILDNSITAMTGMQPTPESGITADGHPGNPLSIEELVKGCGVKYIRVVNPYDIKGMIQEAKRAYEYTKQPEGGMAVLISRYPCITYQKEQLKIKPMKLDIRHVRDPGQRVPIGRVSVAESPFDVGPIQAREDIGVFDNVLEVVVTDELIPPDRPEGGDRDQADPGFPELQGHHREGEDLPLVPAAILRRGHY